MRTRKKAWTTAWLMLLIVVQVLAFLALWRYAVGTQHGQWLDTVALTGNRIGQDRVEEPVNRVLNAMSVVSLLAATAFIGFIALIRGRIALAIMATLLIAGANATTQLLKYGLVRPDFGIDPDRAAVGNSLPSGHSAVAASVAVALVLVLPRQVRALGAVLGTTYAAFAGVATLSAGWHRPSDTVASFLVVGAWAALAGIVLLFTQRDEAQVESDDAHRVVGGVLGIGGLMLLVGSAMALVWISGDGLPDPEGLARRTLLTGYAGSAVGIVGTMGVIMTLVLTSVHRLVPRHKG